MPSNDDIGSRNATSDPDARGRDIAILAALAVLVLVFVDAMGEAAAWVLPVSAAVVGLTALFVYRLGAVPSGGAAADSQKAKDVAATEAAATALMRLPDPLLLVDGAGRIVLATPAARALFGQAAERKHVSSVLRAPSVLSAVERVAAGGPAEEVDYVTLVPIERHYEVHVVPVPTADGDGDSVWALIVLHDLTSVRAVERMRADFVANASHELRTPLASLTGFIETLRGHARDDEDARERFLEIMNTQAQRMRRLIDDLLSLSRIELNEHVLPSGRVDLVSVVRDVVDAAQPAIAAAKATVTIVPAEGLSPVLGDRDELVQVFQNLIDNALKYGGTGGAIVVTLAPETSDSGEPMIAVRVRDQGPGIAREHLPRLTERFYRVDVKESRERGGTGLGLAIVKHIVSRHRGQLTVESDLGKGSEFKVLLPLAPSLA